MKWFFCLQINTKVFCTMMLSFWIGITKLTQSTQITTLQYLCNISRRIGRMKLIFCLQIINIKDFFKLMLSFQVCVTSHAQITQNNKFVISLQYLQKEVSDEVDFLHADNHENFLQMNDMIVVGGWSSIPKIPKITSLQYLCNISKKLREE